MKLQYKHTDTTTKPQNLSLSRGIYKGENITNLEPTYENWLVMGISINDFKSNETTVFIKNRISDDFCNLHIIEDNTVSSYLLRMSGDDVTSIDVDILSTWSLIKKTLYSIYLETSRGRMMVIDDNGFELYHRLLHIALEIENSHPPKTLLRSDYKLLHRWFTPVIEHIQDIEIIEDCPIEEDSLLHFIEREKKDEEYLNRTTKQQGNNK